MPSKFFFKEHELEVLETVYEPQEDSFLLAETVEVKPGVKALDIGCGSGIQSISLALNGAEVTAVDVNPKALACTEANAKALGLSEKIKIKKSNLFSELKEEKFDLVVFNPPYLPDDGPKDAALDGGENGLEIIHSFLDKLSLFLNKDGSGWFIVSSVNGFRSMREYSYRKGFRCEEKARKKLFFEQIAVFKVFV